MTEPGQWLGIRLVDHIQSLSGALVRVVESQEQIATTGLVDSLAEQALLEDLLEQTKPRSRPGSDGLHYLLMTPFRYPPLRYGSRFGQRHERSIFYGSQSPRTALAETAYYRLLFRAGMQSAPTRAIRSQHTLFGARYQATQGLSLQCAPFSSHSSRLTDPGDYSATQALGSAMRAAGIQAFESCSARDAAGGINIGLFEPAALASSTPSYQEEWLCETDGNGTTFLKPSSREIWEFPITDFLVNGTLPHPAT